MMGEIEVARRVDWHQVNMRMRHIDTHHSDAYLDARTDFLQTPCHTAAEQVKIDEQLVVEIENIIHLLLGDTEHMPLHNGIDVEKSQEIIRLGNLVAGYLTRHDT